MTVYRYVLRSWVLGLAALSLVACGGQEEKPAPAPSATQSARPSPAPQTDSSVAQGDDRALPDAEGPPSQQLRRKIALPADYPSDAPIYPGSEPSQVTRKGARRMVVMFGSSDSPDQVMDYLEGDLPGKGWSVSGRHDLPTGKLIQATKGDRLVSVLLSRVDEGRDSAITMIAVSVDS